MNELIAVRDDSLSEIAGALVWWELSGNLPLENLQDAMEAVGIPTDWSPATPRMETVAQRAAQACIEHNRQKVRPLGKRGNFDFVTESVETEEVNGQLQQKLVYHANVRVTVEEVEGDTKRSTKVEPTRSTDVQLANRIAESITTYTDLLIPVDVSSWLLWILENRVSAVSLRQRGGFYFVPAGEPLETWKKVARCIEICSKHVCSRMSAVKSDDAVKAILKAVRDEADAKLLELETYLDGKVTTRGINSWTRDIGLLQEKMARYSELLGIELAETSARAVTLLGCLTATKLVEVDG